MRKMDQYSLEGEAQYHRKNDCYGYDKSRLLNRTRIFD